MKLNKEVIKSLKFEGSQIYNVEDFNGNYKVTADIWSNKDLKVIEAYVNKYKDGHYIGRHYYNREVVAND